jgi:hypothetical protein
MVMVILIQDVVMGLVNDPCLGIGFFYLVSQLVKVQFKLNDFGFFDQTLFIV